MDNKIIETEDRVIESFDNCWRALCRQYSDDPDDTLRMSINFLARIIQKVKSELKNKHEQKNKQMSIDDWIKWFESEEN